MDINDLKRRAGITETEADEMNYFGTEMDKLIQRMEHVMNQMIARVEKARPMSYQDTGAGGRQQDQHAVDMIARIESDINALDSAIDVLQQSQHPESPKNW